jgi:hypothetical protein
LREAADEAPQDAAKQAAYLAALNQTHPRDVLSRVESKAFASSPAVVVEYLKALVATERLNEFADVPGSSGAAGSSGSSAAVGLGPLLAPGQDHRSLVALLRDLQGMAEGQSATDEPGSSLRRPLHVVLQVGLECSKVTCRCMTWFASCQHQQMIRLRAVLCGGRVCSEASCMRVVGGCGRVCSAWGNTCCCVHRCCVIQLLALPHFAATSVVSIPGVAWTLVRCGMRFATATCTCTRTTNVYLRTGFETTMVGLPTCCPFAAAAGPWPSAAAETVRPTQRAVGPHKHADAAAGAVVYVAGWQPGAAAHEQRSVRVTCSSRQLLHGCRWVRVC